MMQVVETCSKLRQPKLHTCYMRKTAYGLLSQVEAIKLPTMMQVVDYFCGKLWQVDSTGLTHNRPNMKLDLT
eukprot:scaffold48138_cov76-Cyclotella_meneghiniana.AAC.3